MEGWVGLGGMGAELAEEGSLVELVEVDLSDVYLLYEFSVPGLSRDAASPIENGKRLSDREIERLREKEREGNLDGSFFCSSGR